MKKTTTKTRKKRKTRTETTNRYRYEWEMGQASVRLQPSLLRWSVLSLVVLLLSCSGLTAGLAAQDASMPAKVPTSNPVPSHKTGSPYALIFGTAWDSENNPVYGVHVLLRRPGDKRPHWEAYSDHRGEFAFRVPAGKATYELVGDLKSDKSHKIKGLETNEPVKVQIQFDERVDVGLHLIER